VNRSDAGLTATSDGDMMSHFGKNGGVIAHVQTARRFARSSRRDKALNQMIKKLTKHGNSQVIIIEKPILDLLGWDKDTALKLSTPDGKCIVISKAPLSQPKSNET
jgi:hypothetical protein